MILSGNFHKKGLDINDIMEIAQKEAAVQIDFKVINVWGQLYHMTMPAELLTNKLCENGIGFDGSSVGGYAFDPAFSDCRMKPDITTAFIDPFFEIKTISFLCDVVMAENPQQIHPLCPRSISRKAEKYLSDCFPNTKSKWGPELEFFLLDDVRYDIDKNSCFYVIDSKEACWNRGVNLNPNFGNTIKYQKGYSIAPPFDQIVQIRSQMAKMAQDLGIGIKVHHHEVASPGQCELELDFDILPFSADKVTVLKYIIRNEAIRNKMTSTFMPKPLANENGSGLHLHQHFFQDNKPLFYDEQGAFFKMSKWAMSYIAGILIHAPALMAFTNPSTNSFKRLLPGFEAPTNITFSLGDRTAAIRIPKYATDPKDKRIEYRPPDATANIYYAMAAIQLAGLDGVKKDLDPVKMGFSIDKKKKNKQLPASLNEALDILKKEHGFLTDSGVFTEELIEVWIDQKRKEIEELNKLPHPYEFIQYYNC
ncbi:MAG: type I glutamate--ammonia ligase [Candidatus Coatesbacteria bacterium]|nr:type I glutamate--ammonia ligase [Candidatus Coatesbacteria bacterium]